MMNVWLKDAVRSIRKAFPQFLSIAAIVALGTGFFAGVKATSPDMKNTADTYYKEQRLSDIRLLSTYGFNDNDVKAVENTAGIRTVYPTYSSDVMAKAGDEAEAVKVIAYSDADNALNRPRLTEGRLPKAEGECVVDSTDRLGEKYKIGDTITLFSGNDDELSDSLKRDTYTVVGRVMSPRYVNFNRDNTTIGKGKINFFIMVPVANFASSVYTDLYIDFTETSDMAFYDERYTAIIEEKTKLLETISDSRSSERLLEEIASEKQKLADAKEKYESGKNTLETELEKAKTELEQGEKDYKSGLLAYEKGLAEYKTKISDAQKKLDESKAALDAAEGQYKAGLAEYNKGNEQLGELKSAITGISAQIKALEEQIASGAPPENGEAVLLALRQKQQALTLQYDAANQKLSAAKAELDAAKEKLDAGKAQYQAGKAEFEKQKTDGAATLEKSKSQLDAAKKKIDSGWTSYHKTAAEKQKELDDAAAKIKDGEQKLSEVKAPKWYISDRSDNIGYAAYSDDADRIDNIASVFPLFFLIVAALVCLTTMTRMVDEQRSIIGTFKAIGYSRGAIIGKFLLYGCLAAFLGSVIGLAVGFYLFPTVICGAYGIMYIFPPVIADFKWDYALIITAISVGGTALVTLASAWGVQRAEAAELMRPKAPKPGKRVFLEFIPVLWKRFNFMAKVTSRNLFRYKKRLLMTIIGISGCTALIVSGFGLRDSIFNIVSNQFNEIYHYDVLSVYDGETGRKSAESILSPENAVGKNLFVHQDEVTVKTDGGRSRQEVALMVPETPEGIGDFITLQTYPDKTPLKISDSGAIINEKLANLSGKREGDTIVYTDSENNSYEIKIAGVTEHYTQHYIYMSPQYYHTVTGTQAVSNTALSNLSDTSGGAVDTLEKKLASGDNILTFEMILTLKGNFGDMVGNLAYVVLIMILSAGLLALVVMYNLTNINITERSREIATLKVLGFYDREVIQYVFRENLILTLMGTAVGLLLGLLLHRYLLATAESDVFMFDRSLSWFSFFMGAVLTLAFSFLVNFLLYFRLRKIDMVESLKSVE